MNRARLRAIPIAFAFSMMAIAWPQHAGQAELNKQLRLAREEGLPLTAADFNELIPPVKDSENAALLYEKLPREMPIVPSRLPLDLIFDPNPALPSQAEKLLSRNKASLAILDQAVRRPHCRFNRDWSKGFDLIFPEIPAIRNGGRLLILRGSLEARNGDCVAAVADATAVFTISRHLQEEPVAISQLMGVFFWVTAERALGAWWFHDHGQRLYRKAYLDGLAQYPRFDPRSQESGVTLGLLHLYHQVENGETDPYALPGPTDKDNLKTERKNKELRSKSHHSPEEEAGIVRAGREYWRALGLTKSERIRAAAKANSDLMQALRHDAAMKQALIQFGSVDGGPFLDGLENREDGYVWGKQEYVALGRALSETPVPEAIRTQDLLSPVDGKPLQYKYDGKQITITVSAGSGMKARPIELKLPPDSVK
ncbi:MAG TPA: hypothetical protein VGL56_06140 [Fimbriimonadaceae bacterium]